MTTPAVKCNVANCTYWGEGNRCHADSIHIELDARADGFNEEFSGELAEAGWKDQVAEASKTCCLTFKPKQKSN